MRTEQNNTSLLLLIDIFQRLATVLFIQASKRFIQDNDPAVVEQCPDERCSSFHAAGELADRLVQLIFRQKLRQFLTDH